MMKYPVCLVIGALISGCLDGGSAASVKIIGGETTYPGEFPMVVSVQFNPLKRHKTRVTPICVGAVLDKTHIVTAAHCAGPYKANELEIVAGAYNISKVEATQQRVSVKGIYVHPKYEEYQSTSRNDIAIVRIDAINYTSFVQAVNLPPKNHEPNGNCWIAGWGQTSSEIGSKVLEKGLVSIVNTTRCSEIYPALYDRAIQVCAGKSGVDACLYDTGGPLLCNDLGKTYIAGIVSWGYGCALEGYPGVYTRIPMYVDWMAEFQSNK